MKKRDFRTLSFDAQYEIKLLAIRMIKAEKKQIEVSKHLSVRKQTISQWWKTYTNEGMKGLRNKRRGRQTGENRTLTVEMEKQIQRAIVDKFPEQMKLPFVLWTRHAVQMLIKQKYDVSIPIRKVGEYLKRWGFTPKNQLSVRMNSNLRKSKNGWIISIQ